MSKVFKISVFALICSSVLFFIFLIFYEQEVKYAYPTPIPKNFEDKVIGELVKDDQVLNLQKESATLFHFFSFDCSCSRFNIASFENVVKKYRDKINIIVLLQSEDKKDITRFQKKYDLNLPVVLDHSGIISDKLGIYATPQAVILDTDSRIYFKGNYNKARFCTKKQTQYVEIALTTFLKGEELPDILLQEMAMPYGCSLPSDLADINKDKLWIQHLISY